MNENNRLTSVCNLFGRVDKDVARFQSEKSLYFCVYMRISGAENGDSMKERLKDSEREEVDRILSVIKWQRMKRRASNQFRDSAPPALFAPVSEVEVKNGVKLVVPPIYDELVEREGYGNLSSYEDLAISECLLKLPMTARHLDAILLDGGRRWEAAAKAQFPMFFQPSKQSILASVFSNQQNGKKYVCMYVCMYVCVCVFVRARWRERERRKKRGEGKRSLIFLRRGFVPFSFAHIPLKNT